MWLRAYLEHTQDVYGRAVRRFQNFSGKPAETLSEQNVRNYVLHLINSSLIPYWAVKNKNIHLARIAVLAFYQIAVDCPFSLS